MSSGPSLDRAMPPLGAKKLDSRLRWSTCLCQSEGDRTATRLPTFKHRRRHGEMRRRLGVGRRRRCRASVIFGVWGTCGDGSNPTHALAQDPLDRLHTLSLASLLSQRCTKSCLILRLSAAGKSGKRFSNS